jgi:Flp pilus assembly protein TadG
MKRIPIQSRANRRNARRRKGAVLTVELLFILPLLTIVLLAIAEFSFMLLAMQAVTAAANVGAREGSLPSSTDTTVEQAVEDALAGWVFQGREETKTFVNGSDTNVATAMTGDAIEVTVIVSTPQAVPDLLKFIGLTIEGQEIRATFVTRRE